MARSVFEQYEWWWKLPLRHGMRSCSDERCRGPVPPSTTNLVGRRLVSIETCSCMYLMRGPWVMRMLATKTYVVDKTCCRTDPQYRLKYMNSCWSLWPPATVDTTAETADTAAGAADAVAEAADAAAEVAVENAGTAASRWQSRRQVGHYHGSP